MVETGKHSGVLVATPSCASGFEKEMEGFIVVNSEACKLAKGDTSCTIFVVVAVTAPEKSRAPCIEPSGFKMSMFG